MQVSPLREGTHLAGQIKNEISKLLNLILLVRALATNFRDFGPSISLLSWSTQCPVHIERYLRALLGHSSRAEAELET